MWTSSVERLHLASQIVEQSYDGLLAVDRSQTIRYANRTLSQALGYTSLEGMPLSRLLPEELRKRHHDLVEGFFQNPTTRMMSQAIRVQLVAQDGSSVHASVGLSVALTVLVDGGIVAVATIRMESHDRAP